MRVIDLSHTIKAGMPCYPGTPGPLFQPLASIDEHGFAEQLLTISSHTGTHVDLPSHILLSGSSLDAFTVDRFAGAGVAIDLRGISGGIITVETLHPFRDLIQKSEFLLLCSGWSQHWGALDYYAGYPILSSEAARWLTGFHLKGVGVDMISVDAPESADFSVHRILLQKEIVIIENLVCPPILLYSVFTFCGFPLKIVGAEASPLRAVAFIEE